MVGESVLIFLSLKGLILQPQEFIWDDQLVARMIIAETIVGLHLHTIHGIPAAVAQGPLSPDLIVVVAQGPPSPDLIVVVAHRPHPDLIVVVIRVHELIVLVLAATD